MGEKKSKPLFVESGFKFVTSRGADFGIGPLVLSGGGIYVDSDSDCNRRLLNFRAVGVGKGVADVSFDFATPSMYSDGRIYTNTFRNAKVTIDDLTGPCLIYQGQIAPSGTGMAGTIMFLSVGLGLAAGWAAFSTGIGASLAPAIVISSCRAVVVYWGNIWALPGNAGVSGALGYLSLSDALVMKSAFSKLAEAAK